MAHDFDISKLTGRLQQLAYEADADKSGHIDTESEYSVFASRADADYRAGNIADDDYKNIFGFVPTTEVKEEVVVDSPETSKTPATTTPENFSKNVNSKAQKKAYETKGNVIIDHLETMVNKKPEEIIQGLRDKLGSGANEPEYQILLSQVETILNKVNEVRSQKGIKHLEKNVKNSFPKGTLDDFGKDVLKLLVDNAENAQSAEAYDEIAKAYEEKRSQGMGRKEAYEAVKKEFKNKSPEHKEVLRKRGMFNQNKSKFESRYIMKEAREDVREAIYESDATTSRKVKKDAKTELKDDKNYDKYTRRALNGENNFGTWVSGQDSNMKIIRQNQARGNRVENAKTQTEAEIRKAVGDELFEHLKNSGMIVEKEGKYDLAALSDTIKREVGSDLYMDRMSKEKDAIAEKQLTYNRLRAKLGLTEKQLSNSDAKKLVELCGFEIQSNGKLVKALYRGTIGAVVGGLTAGGAEAARKRADGHYSNSQTIQSKLHIDTADLDNMTYEVTIDGVKQPIDKPAIDIKVPENVAGYAQTVVDVVVNVDILKDLIVKGGKFVISNALKGAMIGGAIGALSGLLADDKDEIPVASINVKCSTLKEYVDSLQGIKPEWRDILTTIATTFSDKDGNWDCNAYQEFLKEAAGNDILNKKELLGALKKYETELKNRKDDKPELDHDVKQDSDKNTDPKMDTDSNPTCSVEVSEKTVDTTVTHTRRGGDTWGGVVKAYYPCLVQEKGLSGAIRALKVALATDENGNLNKATYQALLKGGDLPKTMKLPATIGDCEINKDAKVKRVKVHGNGKARIQTVGRGSSYTEYTATDGCEESQSVTARTSKEAVSNLKQKTKKTYANESEYLK